MRFILIFIEFAWLLLAGARVFALELDVKSQLPKGATSIPLKVFADRPFITVTINGGTACECVIDTGSEVTLLNKARVPLKNVRVGAVDRLEGSFVGALEGQRMTLDSLAFGDYVLKNVGLTMVDHKPGQKLAQLDMILGIDVLSKLRFTLDFANERFIVWAGRSEFPKPAENLERLRVAIQRGSGDERPHVVATVNQKTRVSFLLDSGADGSFVALQKFSEYGLQAEGPPTGMARINDGNTQRELHLFKTRFARLDIDKTSFLDVPTRVIDASTVVGPLARQDLNSFYNILGLPFLKTLQAVHFDMPGRTLYMDRVKASAK